MKLHRYIVLCFHNIDIQYEYVIPNRGWTSHIWSCKEGQKSPSSTLSTYFNILSYYSQWTKVDDNLPQHTSTPVHSIFIKIIKNFSVDVEIYKTYTRDPLIKPTFYMGVYKGNFVPSYLYSYLIDFKFDCRLLNSISNSNRYITCKWIATLVEKLTFVYEK